MSPKISYGPRTVPDARAIDAAGLYRGARSTSNESRRIQAAARNGAARPRPVARGGRVDEPASVVMSAMCGDAMSCCCDTVSSAHVSSLHQPLEQEQRARARPREVADRKRMV